MLPSGSTWEDVSWNPYRDKSCCHAWSAHPIYHFVNIIGGIRQLSSGWQKVSIDPEYLKYLDFAGATVLTPLGEVTTYWKKYGEKYHLRVTAPPNMILNIKQSTKWQTITGPVRECFIEVNK
jgi:hypothetical protein